MLWMKSKGHGRGPRSNVLGLGPKVLGTRGGLMTASGFAARRHGFGGALDSRCAASKTCVGERAATAPHQSDSGPWAPNPCALQRALSSSVSEKKNLLSRCAL